MAVRANLLSSTFLGPLVAVAIGDTYGAQYEYRKQPWEQPNTGEMYSRHPTHTDLIPGKYTDDAQMSLAIADVVQVLGTLNPAGRFDFPLGQLFVDAYMRDPRAGYSGGMLEAIQKSVRTGISLEQICMTHDKTERSGAAMRATPIGLLPDMDMVRDFARYQGTVTHKDTALDAAEAAALASHYMLYRLGARKDLPQFLADTTGNGIWLEPWCDPVGNPGMDSTRAALTAVVQATSLRDVLIRSIAFTGDVDTVGAIAMGAAWAYPDLPNDLPYSLWDGLENGTYGRDFLRDFDTRMLAQFRLNRRD